METTAQEIRREFPLQVRWELSKFIPDTILVNTLEGLMRLTKEVLFALNERGCFVTPQNARTILHAAMLVSNFKRIRFSKLLKKAKKDYKTRTVMLTSSEFIDLETALVYDEMEVQTMWT